MSLRDTLNLGDANRTPAVFSKLLLGDVLNLLITALAVTESAITVTANVATLANTPSTLLQINATAGTTTGVKKLLRGPVTGATAIVPLTGQAVWDGGVKVLFSTVDAVTAASFTYARAANVTASILQRDIEEQDT